MTLIVLTISSLIAATPPGKSVPEIQLAGLLTEQGQKRCTKGTKESKESAVTWVDDHLQVGFARLTGPTPPNKDWIGRAVVATGHVDSQFAWPKVVSEGPCPVPQMRSDMVWSKSGMRLNRSPRVGIGTFKQTAVRPLTELKAEISGGAMKVSYTNPLDVPIEGLTLRVHFEQCAGKPNSLSRDKMFPRLPPGRTARGIFADILEEKNPSPRSPVYRAWSVQIIVRSSGNMRFALDVPTSALGLNIQCPDRLGLKPTR
jgi:hypothetical protein